jgi:hypothetical protein
MRSAAACLATIVAAAGGAMPARALAAEQLTAAPTISGKLGGSGIFTVKASMTSTLGGIPSPLGQFVIDAPPGPTFNFASAPVCPLDTITAAEGSVPPVCPAGSQIGSGSASVEAILGSTTLMETAPLDIYLTSRSPIVYEVWASGTTPIAETLTFPGTLTIAGAPFGEKISVSVPPIPTVPGGPDASVVSLTFAVGGTHPVTTTRTIKRGRTSVRQTVRTSVGLIELPKKCPASLPYTATATFQDGSSPTVAGRLACP